MRSLRAWLLRLLRSFKKTRQDREFADELESHLLMHIEDNLRSGMTPNEARRRALISLGGVESTKERYRDRRGIPVIESFLQDLRYVLRLLGRNRGFTTIALLTLALGIGANTATFSILNALVLRKLPVRQPQQLVSLSIVRPGDQSDDLSFPLFEQISRRQTVFSAMFAYWGDAALNVESDGQMSLGDIWAVTGNFCSELGLRAHLGRLLDSTDVNLHGALPASVAVIGYGFWQRHYGGDVSVLGKTVKVEGVPFTVVGVMQKGFTGMGIANEADITIPLTAQPLIFGADPGRIYTANSPAVSVAGRLKDGVTLTQARANVETLWAGVLEDTLPTNPDANRRSDYLAQRIEVQTAARGKGGWLHRRFDRPVAALMGVSALILLIACINLASLSLARAAARSHEMGVRAALGASRFRIARLLLLESLMLSLVGAGGAIAVASWVALWLRDAIMREFVVPPALDVRPDVAVVAFTTGIAIVAGILVGIAPSLISMRGDPALSLQQGSRTIGGSTGKLGTLLIGVQVALSVVMLMSAGLFLRSFSKLRSLDPGFREQDIMVVKLLPVPGGYKNLDNGSYYPELADRISNLPGVRRASILHMRPLSNITANEPVAPASALAVADEFGSDLQTVSPQFFETLGISLLEGRDFTWRDHEKAPRVAILGSRLARRLFPSGGAVGQRIRIGKDQARQNVEVVGVVSDASLWSLRHTNSLEVYIPLLQGYAQWSELIVWWDGTTAALADSIRREIRNLGHEYPFRVSMLAADADQSMMEEKLTAMLSGFYAGLSLLLAAIGLYGLVSYAVARRTREIGIRMALGAQRGSVLWMVLRGVLFLVASGVAIGVPFAVLAARLIANLLFGISPSDPITLALVVTVLLGTGVAAAYLPARRASRSDPLVALRYE
jgi:predicted permease